MLHLSNFNGLLVEFCPSVCLTSRLVEQNAAKWRPVSLGLPASLSGCKNQLSEWARGCSRWWTHCLCGPDSVKRETLKKWQNKDDFGVLRWKRGSICADLGTLEDVMAGGQLCRNISSNCWWGTQTVQSSFFRPAAENRRFFGVENAKWWNRRIY